MLAYALGPVDLSPDFIPVPVLLGDVLLVPAGRWLAQRHGLLEVLSGARTLAACHPQALAPRV